VNPRMAQSSQIGDTAKDYSYDGIYIDTYDEIKDKNANSPKIEI
jgi:hypothetical protein